MAHRRRLREIYHPNQGTPAALEARWKKTALAKEAAHHGTCARFAINTVLERSGPDGRWPATVPMFEQDAYEHARAAAYYAIQRLALDPLTVAQDRMLWIIRRMTEAQRSWTGPADLGGGWVQWWDMVNDWQKAPIHFGPKAADQVWAILEARGLVEHHPGDDGLVRAKPAEEK